MAAGIFGVVVAWLSRRTNIGVARLNMPPAPVWPEKHGTTGGYVILWDDTDRFPSALSPVNIENYINPKRMFKVRPAEQAYLDEQRYEEKPEHYKQCINR